MLRNFIFLSILFLAALACRDSNTMHPSGSLGAYIESTELPVVYHSLIACAASGKEGILANSSNQDISVIFYPFVGASNFKYFQGDQVGNDDAQKSFQEIELNDFPMFNGYLRRFQGEGIQGDGQVTFIYEDELYISDVITVKNNSLSTIYNPDGTQILNTNSTQPTFNWVENNQARDVIYFQVISDISNNLISGTYTTDRTFTFYDLSNVVLNIRDINPPPVLESNNTYSFVMMGVSEDNWVNTLIDTSFTLN